MHTLLERKEKRLFAVEYQYASNTVDRLGKTIRQCTLKGLTDPGHKLDTATVTVNKAIHTEVIGAVSEAEEGQEAKGRGKDNTTRLRCHCSKLIFSCLVGDGFIFEEDYISAE